MMLRKLNWLSLLLIFAASCKAHHTPEKAPAMTITTTIVRADSIAARYRFTSHLQSRTRAIIQPRVSGYLLQKSYRAGEMVRRGQRLFTIDASLLRTTLRSAEAQLSAAIAEQTTARNDYERALPLARLNAISASQLDAYRATFASAEGAVKAAREAVENARLQVGYATINAPIDGIVANSEANEGDYVGPDTQYSVLTTIDAIDTLTFDVAIPTSLYMQHSDPSRPSSDNSTLLTDIRLRLSDGQEYPHRGLYDYTRQSISPTAGTITIVVAFPNRGGVWHWPSAKGNHSATRGCYYTTKQTYSVGNRQGQHRPMARSNARRGHLWPLDYSSRSIRGRASCNRR